MKCVLSSAIVFVFVAIALCDLTPEEENAEFSKYLSEFKVRLGRSDSVEKVKKTFVDRYNEVNRHNSEYENGNSSYELAIDEFAHVSYDEFVRLRTGYIPSSDNDTGGEPAPEDSRRGGRALATTFSWLNTAGVVRAVQNQGSCGSCWAFAALGAIEGQMAISKQSTAILSEQEVIECARNQYSGALLGCNGGWHYSAYDHARLNNGITTQSNRPYRGNTNSGCYTSSTRTSGSKVKSYSIVPANNEASMQNNLVNNGPLYVTFYVSSDFQSYRSGVYTDSKGYCNGKTNNHAVLLVGYGVQDGIPYWLVKNSWGTGWGEAGYFKMERGKNRCGIAKTVNYPTLA